MRFLFRKQKLKRTFQCCQQKKKATLVVDPHLNPQTRTKKKLCSIQKRKADTEAPKKLEKTHTRMPFLKISNIGFFEKKKKKLGKKKLIGIGAIFD